MIYKTIGEIIEVQKCRNKDLSANTLLGINIEKKFVPSVANIVGTDLSTYKIVKKGRFACNRMHVGRDRVLPISLSDIEEEFIVSPAYDVFAVKESEGVLSEYLMIRFSRKEFDKEARFYTDGDVRGGLPWESFCNIKIPVPSENEQRKIINEYITIQNRININNSIIQKLEEAALTLYKHRFVDFEFPDLQNNSYVKYKSEGGKMIRNKDIEKEVPSCWEVKELGSIIEENGKSSLKVKDIGIDGSFPFFTSGKGILYHDEYLVDGLNCYLNTGGSGDIKVYYGKANYSTDTRCIRGKGNYTGYLSQILLSLKPQLDVKFFAGTGLLHLQKDLLKKEKILIPTDNLINKFGDKIIKITGHISNLRSENRKISNLINLILQGI